MGLRFYLVDPVRVESYWCTKDGFVAVEIGTHKAITPPLWYWKIHDGRLQLSDEDFDHGRIYTTQDGRWLPHRTQTIRCDRIFPLSL